jgi:putative phosphoesterase
MKIGIISDVHGNYEALKEVLAALDEMNVSEMYCLGDLAGYYSQVNECCNEIRAREIQCIMGNHDWYLTSGFCLRSRSVNDCLEYQRKVISSENLKWLRNLPFQIQKNTIRMIHGGWTNPIDEYLKPSAEYFSQVDGEIFFSGHTHVQMTESYADKIYCNPGSVGQPRDNDPRAAFAIYDGEIQLHRVEYDVEKVFQLMDEAGFNNYYYGCLKTGNRYLCKLQ